MKKDFDNQALSLFRPRKLSIFTGLFLAFVAVAAFLLVSKGAPNPILAIFFFLIIWLCSFLIINFSLDRYFYQNIRSIYHNIVQLRSGSSAFIPRKLKDHEIIPEIERILIEWEKEKREEIGRLKEVEVFRKEFLGNVSHELKTPIFTIQGYIHTLLDGGIDDMDVNILYLQRASKGIDRLISIVDDLEVISRLEGGDQMLESRTFEIVELATEVIESLELMAKEKYIRLLVRDPEKSRQYVLGDKDLIRQVLVNLLVNSVKYGKEHGITWVELNDQGDFVTVSVSDDGIGIEKHHLPRLFERFYRVDKSRSRDQGGTGLGLAIVKHIIEAHGEKITVDSMVGKGTVFTFTLKKSK
jgi:two-component system phosphate regulon sensor histidine kinase PhoR